MTAPVADKIILPLDTGNTGKKKRTLTRVVGSDTVHSDYVIVEDPRSVVGSYKCSSGVLTVPIAAQPIELTLEKVRRSERLAAPIEDDEEMMIEEAMALLAMAA